MDLLERDHCFTQLSALLHLATTGHGRTVLISGEAGIGKTALVEQFVSQHCGAATRLWGACEALFTPRPLGPLYDIATQVGGRLSALLAGTSERATVFSALLEELQKRPVPTIVVFEDVHWADEATLDLIKFLGRRIPHLPVLFLLTYRDPELSLDHALQAVWGDLPSTAVVRLPLPPLSEHAVISLAQQARRDAKELYATTRGNPFFVTEVLASDAPGVPLTVRDAVIARIARLSAEARTLLELVSVIPARTERWLLSAILCSPEAALEECLTCGMLVWDHTTVAFRHELARLAVESALSPLRRQMLHAQVLGALRNQGEDPLQPARLVHHALGADDSALAARYALLAARQAAAQGAHREAAAYYATALGEASQFALEQQAEMLEGRAYECYLTGQIEEAIEARHAALEIWRQLKRGDQVGQTMRWLSRLYWFLGKPCEAEYYADEAVELLETLPPTSKLAMAYSNRAQLFMIADHTAEAVRWGERAITLAEEVGDVETLVHALNNVGTALFTGTEELGRAHLERSLQLAQERGWEEHVARAYTNLACGAIRGRNYALAERFVQDGLAYCTEHDLDAWGTYIRAWLGQARFERGAWDDAVVEATRVLDHAPLTIASRIPALVVLGGVGVRRGDPGSTPILDEARNLALTTEEIQRIAPVAAGRAEAAWLRGDLEQCLTEAQMGYDLGLKYLDPWRLGSLAFWMWRAGGLTSVPSPIAEPFARQIQGDWQGAAQLWAQIGCPYEQALALADGNTEAMLEALALLEQLGARPAAALVRGRLRKQGVTGLPRGPRLSTRTNWAGLTSRQQEVLRLMAEGFSNAEIASRLVASPRTIEHHVAAVLAKLAVHSRAEAIHAAARQELFLPVGD